MQGVSLKSRAIAFALCVGAAAFILAVVAASDSTSTVDSVPRALIIALVCGVLSWASAERALAGIAEAVDGAIDRVVKAAEGDLASPTPDVVSEALPQLSGALDGMFDQVRSNLEHATSLALFDPVTALANRTHFRHEVERVMAAAQDGSTGALAFIDLDHFKTVNDTLGHAAGDQLLARIANRLRAVAAAETARSVDNTREAIVGRLAGDEFTVYLPGLDSDRDAARVGQVLLDAMSRPFDLAGQEIRVGASIGIALWPEHGAGLTPLMRAADVAMYHAKALGRGQVQFFADSLADRITQRSQLETELRAAMVRNEFRTVFQPQVALGDGTVVLAEGLLRWQHPTDGLRLPASFLPCAEESGLIGEIGDWGIEETARVAAAWPNNGLAPRLAANISPRQIVRPEFFARLRGALARQSAPMTVIEFEVSEALLMQSGPTTIEQIAALRRDGATIAIDDFGAGSSSLSRLRSLPFDAVKLDASLIAGIEHDASARDVAQAVIGLVHSLGARAVAEEVETAGQLEILRVMGCDAAQGYAIAPPMTDDAYRVWAANTAFKTAA